MNLELMTYGLYPITIRNKATYHESHSKYQRLSEDLRNDNQSLYELITVIGKGVEETLEIWNSRFVDLKQIKKRHK